MPAYVRVLSPEETRARIVETAEALPRLPDIARANPRVVALGVGGEDLATEMELLKHPFRGGVKAQAGVEF